VLLEYRSQITGMRSGYYSAFVHRMEKCKNKTFRRIFSDSFLRCSRVLDALNCDVCGIVRECVVRS